jgi:membrane protein DedA with SNARE-associated domain
MTIDQILQFVETYGVAVVFVYVFLDQIGVPVPGVAGLLLFGALAGAGRIDTIAALAAAVAGSLASDMLWYHLGRRRGASVLALLCKVSLEPDSCVSDTRDLFARHGPKSLLVAKFVPGFDTVAPPLAGMLGIPFGRFTALSAAGALVWIFAFGAVGYALSGQIRDVAEVAETWTGTLGWIVLGVVVAYLAWKVAQRQRVLRAIRTARITPEELHAMIRDGREPVVIDARGGAGTGVAPVVIPGALRIGLDEIDARHAEIPRDREVVVYCS